MDKLILVGAGGHSKSVVSSIQKDKFKLCGFIDENKKGMHMGFPILGKRIEDIPNYHSYKYLVSIGDVYFRKMWFEKIKFMGLETVNIIDKSAIIDSSVQIGTGNFIGKMAIINADAIIGDNNIINTKASIEHECVLGNNIHLSTNSIINGNVVVEDNVFLGSSSVSNGQLKIGHDSIVGSGSVIINNVQAFTTVVGVPARVVKKRSQG
ncbi:acetyltransferase [Clostridium perfringens]|uniref:acetyltransferase n=1 Tax=Clostridium perfringens TaxID=1502 RepID=UPI00220749E5|nr:acetyltransferase [Clostridium perfringens]ELC8425425.1 acetyltransferase [Clostridium perfringens]ELC8426486.1 acetyltransferase [Clostridium perfringens]MDK0762777.1 acetyltransferase [Clostridium perfringens]MDM0958175.1 acetyltransferase [Clostridium perfringens]MDM1009639.1 acetyltransferase [Clostridium perfringens]